MRHSFWAGFFCSVVLCFSLEAKSSADAAKLSRKEKNNLTIKSSELDSKKELKSNVKVYRGAYTIRGIPMIDQGDQPKCAPCSLKRLLDYYAGGNSKVSLTTIEKALGYTNKTGTNIAMMVKAIERYSGQLKMQCAPLYAAFDSNDICEKYLKEYNKLTLKAKVPEDPAVFKEQDAYEEMLKKMDYKSWRSARAVDKRAKDIQKKILKNIKDGYPIMWSVTLGLYKENVGKANKIGGHMRLIIGIDPEKQELYYTDSWGSNHIKKKMPWEDAWAITTCMILVRP